MAKESKVSLKKVGYSEKNKSGYTSKFWNTWTHGKNLVCQWGKIGTDGQIRTWSFHSAYAATAKMYDKVDSKLRKGYTYA